LGSGIDEIWVPVENGLLSIAGAVTWKNYNRMFLDKSLTYTQGGTEHTVKLPVAPLTNMEGLVFKLSTQSLVPTTKTLPKPALCYVLLSPLPSQATFYLSLVIFLENMIQGQWVQLLSAQKTLAASVENKPKYEPDHLVGEIQLFKGTATPMDMEGIFKDIKKIIPKPVQYPSKEFLNFLQLVALSIPEKMKVFLKQINSFVNVEYISQILDMNDFLNLNWTHRNKGCSANFV
jgi:hypothetical protein